MSILSIAVVLLVAASLVSTLQQLVVDAETKDRYRRVVKAIRPRHLLVAPIALLCVGFVGYHLSTLPVLEWGWWSTIGGEGSIATGQTEAAGTSALASIAPLMLMLLLMLGIPLLAHVEEVMFRSGLLAQTALRRGIGNVGFGLVHLVMGVPIGVALALSIGGWFFSREAMSAQRALEAKGTDERLGDSSKARLRTRHGDDVRRAFTRPSLAEEQALYSSAALHAVYNWLAVTLLSLATIASFA